MLAFTLVGVPEKADASACRRIINFVDRRSVLGFKIKLMNKGSSSALFYL